MQFSFPFMLPLTFWNCSGWLRIKTYNQCKHWHEYAAATNTTYTAKGSSQESNYATNDNFPAKFQFLQMTKTYSRDLEVLP